ncbi:MAG: hypothetical protein KDB53_13275, partial [Planctomycetes bacterium]|nr:hypothetical protein [Planctomycetota bacterium]
MSRVLIRRSQQCRGRVVEEAKAGRIESAEARVREALTWFTALPDRETREEAALLQCLLGDVLARMRRDAEAEMAWERAEALIPGFTEASLRLVERRIDSDLALDPDMAPLYVRYVEAGRKPKIRFGALRRLSRLLAVTLRDKRSEVAWRMQLLQRLHRQAPEVNFARLYLARGHYLRGEYEDAIPHLEALIAANIGAHNVMNLLGRSLEKL